MSNTAWFEEAQYGMFIHWGAYSVAARGEWVMNRERIPLKEYTQKYVKKWKAQKFNPDEWTALAKAAGMKYIVLTTRHHDGFALWDSTVSPFNAAKLGPKRDLIRPFAEAVQKAGLGLGLYYSPSAWSHPDYPQGFYRDWPGENDWASEESRQRFVQFYRAQIRELLTNYGKVDILWLDGCIPTNLDGAETLKMAKELQPHVLVNDRLGPPYDFKSVEQSLKKPDVDCPWESCITLSDNWGYHAGDRDFKSPRQVIASLLANAQNKGNLLLNVGPKADGTIPKKSAETLKAVGGWLSRNGRVLKGLESHPFSWNNTARVTASGNKVYLWFLNEPGETFCWAELTNKCLSARFVGDGGNVSFRQEGDRLFLENLPTPLPDPVLAVIELEVEGKPEALTKTTNFWIPE